MHVGRYSLGSKRMDKSGPWAALRYAKNDTAWAIAELNTEVKRPSFRNPPSPTILAVIPQLDLRSIGTPHIVMGKGLSPSGKRETYCPSIRGSLGADAILAHGHRGSCQY